VRAFILRSVGHSVLNRFNETQQHSLIRCLVKMQRAGKGNCPLCRASTVLDADRCQFARLFASPPDSLMLFLANVDWALMNFMKDWFPVEAKAKIRQNHQETAEDEVRDMGLDPGRCVLM